MFSLFSGVEGVPCVQLTTLLYTKPALTAKL